MYSIIKKIIKIMIQSSPENVILRIATILMNSIIPPVMAFFLGKISLSLVQKSSVSLVKYLGGYVLISFSWNIIARYVNILSQYSYDKILISLREYLMDLQLRIPNNVLESADYIRTRERADLFLDTYAIRFISTTERLIIIIVTISSYSIIFLRINPIFIIIVLAASLPGFFCRAKFVPEMRHMYEELQEDRSYQNWYRNSLTNKDSLKEIRLWGLEKIFYSRYRQLTESILKKQRKHYYRHGFIGGSIESASFGLGLGISLVIGLLLLKNGIIQVDGLVIVINSIVDVQDTFISSYYNILSYKESTLYAKDLFEIEKFIFDSNADKNMKDKQNAIEVRNISFNYPSCEKNVLENVSLVVKQGEKIAIVGENGSGKTTFCKLLLGLYETSNGEIQVNGEDEFSVTFQDYCKYDLNVRDNITLGNIKNHNDEERINESMELSGFKKTYIKRRFDLDTELGTIKGKGVNLSGGEWQKLAISRCFFRNNGNKIIILDEPHASLDPISEAELYEYYNTIIDKEKNTVIYVTHRLSSAKCCDRIIVFDSGRIVEDGSHQELIAKRGKYYKLFSVQNQYYQ
ncbi:ABC transporter ATP-binding protein [Butyrivibrio sp. NC3005]|uniref:ABC transporter ATP-binding protein n=1 Tax=Butyrivibrio sp. NC3005 TaxID=1280685 RepID=UPI00041CB66D|nr:ABC transporter ATP-binding protein [Butyrivibrio sp. NC3005]